MTNNKQQTAVEWLAENIDGYKCPKCGAVEVGAMTPKTIYACGSSDYDQRPNTFSQSEQCLKKLIELVKGGNKL